MPRNLNLKDNEIYSNKSFLSEDLEGRLKYKEELLKYQLKFENGYEVYVDALGKESLYDIDILEFNCNKQLILNIETNKIEEVLFKDNNKAIKTILVKDFNYTFSWSLNPNNTYRCEIYIFKKEV